MPDPTHNPAVELAQAPLRHRGKRMAVILMSLFADRQRPPLDLKPLAGGGDLHHLDAFGNDLEPDVVTRQDPDLQAHVMVWARQNRLGAIQPKTGINGVRPPAGMTREAILPTLAAFI